MRSRSGVHRLHSPGAHLIGPGKSPDLCRVRYEIVAILKRVGVVDTREFTLFLKRLLPSNNALLVESTNYIAVVK